MPVPIRQNLRIGRHLLSQRPRGRKHFPFIVEVEPLFACNLATSRRRSSQRCRLFANRCGRWSTRTEGAPAGRSTDPPGPPVCSAVLKSLGSRVVEGQLQLGVQRDVGRAASDRGADGDELDCVHDHRVHGTLRDLHADHAVRTE